MLTNADKTILKILPRLLPNAAHLLCVWHVNKNIGKRMKSFFRKKYKGPDNNSQRTNYIKSKWKEFLTEWWIIVKSATKIEYKANWAAFTKKFQRNYLKIVQYIAKE